MTALDTNEAALPASTAVIVADTTQLSVDEWLDTRRQGIGGSDAATVCGLNPYQSPFGLWIDKTSDAHLEDTAGEAALWGNLLEPIVRDETAQREQVTIVPSPFMLAHPDRPWQQANLDGIYTDPGTGEPGVYEGKTASVWLAGDWADDDIPARYILQVQHYLAVTGWKHALVACLVGGQRLVTRRLDADPELISHLTSLEDDFWQHVIDRVPPAPDGSAATTEILTHLYDVEPGLVVTVDETTVTEILERRAAADEAIKAATETKDQASNELRVLLGEGVEARTSDGRCLFTWKPQTSRRLDAKALRREYPDLADEFTTETSTRVLRVTKGKS